MFIRPLISFFIFSSSCDSSKDFFGVKLSVFSQTNHIQENMTLLHYFIAYYFEYYRTILHTFLKWIGSTRMLKQGVLDNIRGVDTDFQPWILQ